MSVAVRCARCVAERRAATLAAKVDGSFRSACVTGSLLVLVALASPLPVLAQAAAAVSVDSPAARARAHFERGLEHARNEAWVDALEAFRASLALLDRPATRLNVGAALLRLGRNLEARAEMDALLASSLGESERAQAITIRDHAVEGIRSVEVALEPSDAVVSIDGATAAVRAGHIEVDPGRHTLEARAEGHVSEVREIGPNDSALIVRLRPAPAHLRVLASVPSARIVLDGEERGHGTFTGEVESGRHQLEVAADGYTDFERWVTLSPAEEAEVLAQLEPRRGEDLLESPWFWVTGVGVIVVAGVGIGLGVGLTSSGGLDGGSVGDVLRPR